MENLDKKGSEHEEVKGGIDIEEKSTKVTSNDQQKATLPKIDGIKIIEKVD